MAWLHKQLKNFPQGSPLKWVQAAAAIAPVVMDKMKDNKDSGGGGKSEKDSYKIPTVDDNPYRGSSNI